MCNYTNGLFYKFYWYEILTHIKGIMIVIVDWNIYPVENGRTFFCMQSWYKPPLTRAIPCTNKKKDSSGYIQNRPVIFQDAQKYII